MNFLRTSENPDLVPSGAKPPSLADSPKASTSENVGFLVWKWDRGESKLGLSSPFWLTKRPKKNGGESLVAVAKFSGYHSDEVAATASLEGEIKQLMWELIR